MYFNPATPSFLCVTMIFAQNILFIVSCKTFKFSVGLLTKQIVKVGPIQIFAYQYC